MFDLRVFSVAMGFPVPHKGSGIVRWAFVFETHHEAL
jgi:hypothetical protein